MAMNLGVRLTRVPELTLKWFTFPEPPFPHPQQDDTTHSQGSCANSKIYTGTLASWLASPIPIRILDQWSDEVKEEGGQAVKTPLLLLMNLVLQSMADVQNNGLADTEAQN